MLVAGHRRIHPSDGTQGDYLYFLHIVRDGRIVTLSAHSSRNEALDLLRSQKRDLVGD